jgi:hypothetical protein
MPTFWRDEGTNLELTGHALVHSRSGDHPTARRWRMAHTRDAQTMSSESEPVEIAILDDYQGVALGMADCPC